MKYIRLADFINRHVKDLEESESKEIVNFNPVIFGIVKETNLKESEQQKYFNDFFFLASQLIYVYLERIEENENSAISQFNPCLN